MYVNTKDLRIILPIEFSTREKFFTRTKSTSFLEYKNGSINVTHYKSTDSKTESTPSPEQVEKITPERHLKKLSIHS